MPEMQIEAPHLPTLVASPTPAPTSYPYPWLADGGDGTYRNPILYTDYSDPDAIRVGDDFYLTASSLNCTPGLPILHSRDLVNWKIIAHALPNVPGTRYEQVQAGCGVWAPALRFHDGKFWIFFATPDEGIYVITAAQPTGPWTEPHLIQAGKGLIDPCPLWDDDGRAYLVHAYAGSRAGIKHRLRVCPMSWDGLKLLGDGHVVFHQPEKHPTLEGPKFHKRDGWYYLSAPAGGVETSWQVVLRSRNIFGPYEDKIVLAQGDTDINGPHQGALVDTADGDWCFLHFQDAGVYGRVLHLQPVRWEDGWPVVGHAGQPVRRHAKPRLHPAQPPCIPQTTDEFTRSSIGLQWQWNANHRDHWHSLVARAGWLRLFPQVRFLPLSEQVNLLLQKFPARAFTAETHLELSARQSGEEAGLVVAGERCAAIGLQRDGSEHWVVLRVDDQVERLRRSASATTRLRVEVRDGGGFSFSYAEAEEFTMVPQTFQATKGKWVGAKLGLYAVKEASRGASGQADFDYFRFF
ncbi:MAG: glycoside hydrolase 43 family protein [Verrucomicrobiota bacterium]